MMLGDFWKVERPQQFDHVIENFRAWVLGNWDWSKPLAIQAKPFEQVRSLSQNALFHVWMKEVRDHFIERTPDADEEAWKLFFKTEYLGTETLKAGKIIHENQLRHTSNLKKGNIARPSIAVQRGECTKLGRLHKNQAIKKSVQICEHPPSRDL